MFQFLCHFGCCLSGEILSVDMLYHKHLFDYFDFTNYCNYWNLSSVKNTALDVVSSKDFSENQKFWLVNLINNSW